MWRATTAISRAKATSECAADCNLSANYLTDGMFQAFWNNNNGGFSFSMISTRELIRLCSNEERIVKTGEIMTHDLGDNRQLIKKAHTDTDKKRLGQKQAERQNHRLKWKA